MLVDNISEIQRVAAPSEPGEYYGDEQDLNVVLNLKASEYGELSVEHFDAHEATINHATTDSFDTVTVMS